MRGALLRLTLLFPLLHVHYALGLAPSDRALLNVRSKPSRLMRTLRHDGEFVYRSPHGRLKAAAPGRPSYWLMHIPKTSGTSWSYDLPTVLPQGDGFVAHEQCYNKLMNFKGHDDQLVTILREPRSQVYSQYLEIADTPYCKDKIQEQHLSVIANLSTWLRHFNGEFTYEDLGCYHPFNMQARAFICSDHMHRAPRNQTSESTSLALKRIQELYFVGISEYYQESVCVFAAKSTNAMPEFCNCEDSASWAKFEPHRDPRQKVRRHSLSDLSDQDLKLIDSLTEDDVKVYKAAMKRFIADASRTEDSYGIKIVCDTALREQMSKTT